MYKDQRFRGQHKEIAAITPRPVFLPVLRLLEGVVEYEEATGTLVTRRWQQRNRRASASLSPVLVHFLEPQGKLYQRLLLEKMLGGIPPVIIPKPQTRSGRRRHSA